MKKKLLVISRNQVSTEFWSRLIHSKNTAISKCSSVGLKAELKDADVIVIDDYFSPSMNPNWIWYMSAYVLLASSKVPVLCISPVFHVKAGAEEKSHSHSEQFTFGQDFIDRLNEALVH